jgi:predicted transcriptional regulator
MKVLSNKFVVTNLINQLETKHISDMFRRVNDTIIEMKVDRLEREFKRFEKKIKEHIDLKFNTLDTKIDELQDLIKKWIDKKEPPATRAEIPDTQSRDLLVDPTTSIAPIVRRKKSKREVLLNIVKMKSV